MGTVFCFAAVALGLTPMLYLYVFPQLEKATEQQHLSVQKLRTAAWGLNTKCSKPNCVLSEKDKKKAHQISSVVISFCEDSKYRDAEDWEARAQKFRVMIQEKSEELDRIEKEILDERKANPKVLAWDDTEGST